MSYTITDDHIILDANGHRLPRTIQARLIDAMNAQLSRPVSLYMMANLNETMLKVGIAENVEKRRYENERDSGTPLQVLHRTVAADRGLAGEIERSIHRFLIALNRGPIYRKEYFRLERQDVWLLRRTLIDMPIKATPGIFNILTADYVPLLREYMTGPAFVMEEIKLQFGTNCAYHAERELKIAKVGVRAA